MKDIANLIYSWNQESEADYLGLPLMLEGLSSLGYKNNFVSYCGAESFFSAFEILERARCIIKTGNDNWYWKIDCCEHGSIGDHPPSVTRRDNLRKQMIEVYGDKSIETSQIVETIIKILWDKIKPGIIKNREELYKQLLSYHVKISFLQKKYSDVLESLDKILEIDESYLPALFGKGNVFQHLGRFDKANEYYDLILNIDKNNIAALVQKANVLFTKKEYEKSLELTNVALNIENLNVHALYAKGMALDHLGKYDEAIQCFNQILKSDKNDIAALLRIAFAYSMMMKPEIAISYYDKILKLNPYHDDALMEKLRLLDYLKNYDEEIKMIDKFLEETPNDPNLLEIKKEIELEKEKNNKEKRGRPKDIERDKT